MIRFYASLAAILTRDIVNRTNLLHLMMEDGRGAETIASQPQIIKDDLLAALRQLLTNREEMPISVSLRRKVERLTKRVEDADDIMTVNDAFVLLKELHNDIVDELSSPYFLMIPVEWRRLYEQPQPLFGDEVASAFPAASGDIAAAGRCVALDEWTASVFHLMRAAEHALRLLARRLRIKKVDTKDWATLIDDVDKVLAATRQRKRTTSRDRRLQYYSHARAHFGVFKDAWRNHVMHSHATYDQRQALNIFSSVQSLMQELAHGVPG
jgi:hypothetical protein